MEIYLIRHTTPIVSEGTCYGQSDPDIDPVKFEEQLPVIQSQLPDDIDRFYSSPLKRCVALTKRLASDFEIDKRVMELDFGKWENTKWNDIDDDELNQWMSDFVNTPVPEGESYLALYKRTVHFLEMLLQTPQRKTAIVTHAGNIRAIISHVLNLPLENSFRIHLNYSTVAHVQLEADHTHCKLFSIR